MAKKQRKIMSFQVNKMQGKLSENPYEDGMTSEALRKLCCDLRILADALQHIEDATDDMTDEEREKAMRGYMWAIKSIPGIADFLTSIGQSMTAALCATYFDKKTED